MDKKKTTPRDVARRILKSGVLSWIIIIGIWWLGSLAYDDYSLPSPPKTV